MGLMNIRESLRELRSRLTACLRKRRLERDLDDELSFHLAMREQQLRAENAPDAPVAARRRFGSQARWREECREVWTFGSMERFFQDLRHGFRALMKRPFLFFVASMSVAIGIALNVSTFGAFKQLLFDSSLSGAARDSRLMAVTTEISYPNYQDLRSTEAFDGFAAMQSATLLWRTNSGTVSLSAKVVSENFFEVLGVRPTHGHAFTANGGQEVLLSFSFWQRRFDSDPAVIGQALNLNGRPFVISGVLPKNYIATVGPLVAASVYVPISAQVCRGLDDRAAGQFDLVARIRQGVTAQRAVASLRNRLQELARQFPVANNGLDRSVSLEPATGVNMWLRLAGGVVVPIAVVVYMVITLVLLVACANVAGVLLTRAQERYREFAVCAALGATRWRLIQRTVAESAIIAGLGGIVGMGLYELAVITAQRMGLTNNIDVIPPALPVFYNCGVVLFVIVACSVAPAFAINQVAPGPVLISSGKAMGRRSAVRAGLVALQMAVCLFLLTGACVLLHGFLRLRNVEPGFDVAHTISLRVRMPATNGVLVPVGPAFADIRKLLLETPGVQSVSSVRFLPLSVLGSRVSIHLEAATDVRATVDVHPVGPHYLETMAIPLLRGRDLSDEDVRIRQDGVMPVITNSNLAQRLFETSDPIGRRIVLERAGRDPERVLQIVGLASNRKLHSLNERNVPILYLPELSTSFVIRVSGSPQSLLRSIERTVIDKVPDSSVQINPMSVEVASALLPTQIGSGLLACLSTISLVLAMLGLYAVISSAVERRRFEIGVRIALGASTGDVLWTILKEATVVMAIGSLAGGLLSLPLVRMLSPLAVADRTSIDASALLAATALLIVISVFASFFPARRAARIDPAIVLRHD
jgi:putative ABC transport system permease protein